MSDGFEISNVVAAVVGGMAALAGKAAFEVVSHWIKNGQQLLLDHERKELLKTMLNAEKGGWRKMSTLSGVIGASRDETARLLISIKARGSESGEDVWALIKNKPLKDIKD